jgi:hypothetical protein
MPRAHSSDSQPAVVLDGETLTIDGTAIPIEHRRMPLADVCLDPSNPRIQHAVKRVSGDGVISAEALLKVILESPGVSELFKLIRDNGGLHDPIFVRPDGRVIEGNCRAASFLKLHSIAPKDSRWLTIPAVFVPKISDRQIAILQGQYHIAGKNKWLAYEKAGHLHHMRTKLGMGEKAIGRAFGMHESEVIKNLQSYEVMTQKLLPKVKSGNGLDKWSFVQELFKRKDLEEYRAKPANIDEFVSLVLDKKLKQGADVRKLGTILKHPNAVKALKKQDVDSAMSVVGKADPTANSGAFRKLKQTTRLLLRMAGPDLDRLRDSEKPQIILRDLFDAVKEVARATGVKLS